MHSYAHLRAFHFMSGQRNKERPVGTVAEGLALRAFSAQGHAAWLIASDKQAQLLFILLLTEAYSG